jgi:hypothetical protein
MTFCDFVENSNSATVVLIHVAVLQNVNYSTGLLATRMNAVGLTQAALVAWIQIVAHFLMYPAL